jgi:hypothetical protein
MEIEPLANGLQRSNEFGSKLQVIQVVYTDATLDRDLAGQGRSIGLHLGNNASGQFCLFHQTGAKLSFPAYSLGGTVDVEIDIVVSKPLQYDRRSLPTELWRVATNLTDDGMLSAVIRQMFVQVWGVGDGLIYHHFRPQSHPLAQYSHQLAEFSGGVIQHWRDVQFFVDMMSRLHWRHWLLLLIVIAC